MKITERDTCRIDGSTLLPVIELGNIKLASFGKDAESAPLTLCKSMDSNLVQLKHTVEPDALFKNYFYTSSLNEAMKNHLEYIYVDSLRFLPTKTSPTVVDIGCNDGFLLSKFSHAQTVGFDPSNISASGMSVFVNDYFASNSYWSNHTSPADIVFTVAMFYDLDDPVEFAENVKDIMADDGIWIMELHYLPFMLSSKGFDAICHEHLTYWNLHTLKIVMDKVGLHILDASVNNVNGGSLRVYIKRTKQLWSPAFRGLYDLENQQDSLRWFAESIIMNARDTQDLLYELKSQGHVVYGLGASTKGNTILQVYDIGVDIMPGISDRDPRKVGTLTQTGIPIVSEEEARAKADYFFIFPYHYTEQLKKREYEFLAKGGKFIVPFPKATIL